MKLRELIPGDKFRITGSTDEVAYFLYERRFDWEFGRYYKGQRRKGRPRKTVPKDFDNPNRIVEVDCYTPADADPHKDQVTHHTFDANIEVELLP